MSATAAFPVRNGVIEGIPVASLAPTPSPRPSPSPSPSSSASPSPTASPTPTPIPMCDVPNLVGVGVGQVQQKWSKAGFATQVVFVPQAPNKPTGKDTVNSQNPASGSLPCLTTAMSVTWSTKP